MLTEPAGDAAAPLTLHQLIRSRMEERGWSYTDLERRSDHALSRGRWQQLGSGARQRKFPDPASLTTIAEVLEVDITAVVLAAAQAVGLDARLEGSDLTRQMPAGTGDISERMRDAILTLIRVAVAEAAGGHDRADLGGEGTVTLEWPKSAAPSRRNRNGPTPGREADAQ